jgi:hypothetical protein
MDIIELIVHQHLMRSELVGVDGVAKTQTPQPSTRLTRHLPITARKKGGGIGAEAEAL